LYIDVGVSVCMNREKERIPLTISLQQRDMVIITYVM